MTPGLHFGHPCCRASWKDALHARNKKFLFVFLAGCYFGVLPSKKITFLPKYTEGQILMYEIFISKSWIVRKVFQLLFTNMWRIWTCRKVFLIPRLKANVCMNETSAGYRCVSVKVKYDAVCSTLNLDLKEETHWKQQKEPEVSPSGWAWQLLFFLWHKIFWLKAEKGFGC